MVCATACVSAVADNSKQSQDSKSDVKVEGFSMTNLDDHKQTFKINAESTGYGSTLESAKADAYSKLLPELIGKTQSIGTNMTESVSRNGIIEAKGYEEMNAETSIKGSWVMKDTIYCYKLHLFLKNPEEKE